MIIAGASIEVQLFKARMHQMLASSQLLSADIQTDLLSSNQHVPSSVQPTASGQQLAVNRKHQLPAADIQGAVTARSKQQVQVTNFSRSITAVTFGLHSRRDCYG
jgi:hypothetical protein